MLLADDLGYADLGVYGCKDIPTPSIDALASQGTRFTDAYSASPYCSPSRAGLLTGRYPERFGHEFNLLPIPEHHDAGLPTDQATLADYLKAAGYRTGLIGKWHLGSSAPFHPMARGFDEFYGFLGGEHSYSKAGPATNPIYDGTVPVAEIPYLTDAFGDRAVDFIHRHKSDPFFLYVAFNAVHFPAEATQKYLARFRAIGDTRRRTYAAMVSALDDNVGKILGALATDDLDDRTLVFFLNDNGGTASPRYAYGASNAPLRGEKRETWEGGIRVAFMVRWKGRLPEGRVDHRPVIHLDVVPTALAAAGVSVRSAWNLDGVDLLPFLAGDRPEAPHDALYWRLGGLMAIRRENWKLVRGEGNFRRSDPSVFDDLSDAGLYDLTDDVGETTDLAGSRPDKVRELADDWKRWNRSLVPPRWPPAPDD